MCVVIMALSVFRDVSYKDINITLLIPMPEVDKQDHRHKSRALKNFEKLWKTLKNSHKLSKNLKHSRKLSKTLKLSETLKLSNSQKFLKTVQNWKNTQKLFENPWKL